MLCGGPVELIKAGFETLVEAGYAPGDGVLRVPARAEADRRPDLRGRHRQHELLDLEQRRVRRVRDAARRSSPTRRKQAMKRDASTRIQTGEYAKELHPREPRRRADAARRAAA